MEGSEFIEKQITHPWSENGIITALSVIVNVRIMVYEDYQTSPSVTIGGDAGT
jgi:hypothetical protein